MAVGTGMNIDYSKFDFKDENFLRSMESKPHIRHIRYLLIKGYSPRSIKGDLHKAALSAPHEEQLIKYYLLILDPAIKHYKLTKYFADYRKRILLKKSKNSGAGDFRQNLLNYRISFENDDYARAQFCKMIKKLEIDDLWKNEIFKFHGSAAKFPVDENGIRILTAAGHQHDFTKVLCCKKRYLVDKMLLERMPGDRIVEYLRKNGITNISTIDIYAYKQVYFRVKSSSIEQTIEAVTNERNAIAQFLNDIDKTTICSDMMPGDILNIKTQNGARLSDLDETLNFLNAAYTEAAYRGAENDEVNFEAMFADVANRGYRRFVELDADGRIDTVDPLLKSMNIMKGAYEKYSEIKSASLANGNGSGDLNAGQVILSLLKTDPDMIRKEEVEKANLKLGITNEDPIDPDDIGGLDEIGGLNLYEDDEGSEALKLKE